MAASDPAGKVVLDLDTGVHAAVARMFSTFTATGSALAVVKAFAADGLRFPRRLATGPHKGELAWGSLQPVLPGSSMSGTVLAVVARGSKRLALGDRITGVGHRVGYDSPSQFSREYRRQFGAPPSIDAVRIHDGAGLAAAALP